MRDPVVSVVRQLQVRKSIPDVLGLINKLLETTEKEDNLLTVRPLQRSDLCCTQLTCTQLLANCPESDGGLQPIATCLLHPQEEVRVATARLCQRIDSHKVCFAFVLRRVSHSG